MKNNRPWEQQNQIQQPQREEHQRADDFLDALRHTLRLLASHHDRKPHHVRGALERLVGEFGYE